MSVCRPLRNSQQCSAWSEDFRYNSTAIIEGLKHSPDGKVNGHDITAPAQIADFDTFISTFSWSGSDMSRDHFRKLFKCQNWDGTGLRYATTYNCLYGVYTASGGCNTELPRIGLCYGTCNDFIDSLDSIFANAQYCSQDAADIEQRRKAVEAYRSGCVLDTSINCVAGNKDDLQTCGFGKSSSQIKQAAQFCSDYPSKACCTAFLSYKTELDKQQKTPNSAFDFEKSGMTWWEWSLVGLGVLVLLGIPIYLFMRYRKNGQRDRAIYREPMPPPALKLDSSNKEMCYVPSGTSYPLASAPHRHDSASANSASMSDFHTRNKLEAIDEEFDDDSTDYLLTSPLASSMSSSSIKSPLLSRDKSLNVSTSNIVTRNLLNNHPKPPKDKVRFRNTLQYVEPSQQGFSSLSSIENFESNTESLHATAVPNAALTNNSCTHPLLVNQHVTNVRPLCVLFGYEPQLPDEIRVAPGDMAVINHMYPEGWSNVSNLTTGQTGMAPTVCFGAKVFP